MSAARHRRRPAPTRVVVERLLPEIDGGRFPIKRVAGERVEVTAHVFADGHDHLAGVLRWRRAAAGPEAGAPAWTEAPLEPVGNDVWRASFTVAEVGRYEYTAEAWVDRFASWRHALEAKAIDGQDVTGDLLEGAALVTEAAARGAADTEALERLAARLGGDTGQADRVALALTPGTAALMASHPDRRAATAYPRALGVTVDAPLAGCGAWYEMFPRSCTDDPSQSGTFRSAEARLPALAAMGFDVLYLPPIHPIGRRFRKGRNNATEARPGDPGSPWAIGAAEGGHTAVHPELGTLDDFDHLVAIARAAGLAVALDIAFQASADHPWLAEHPEWFRRRPDGTIKYAENPPKKYQDIYPIDFESPDWPALWEALRDVFLFWASHGVTIFRVDNPHTKAFAFWEWVIAEVKRQHPDAIFLSEAFTRPRVMAYLAKLGFSQSYTYFTWRNSAHELREYLTELTQTELREYFRPNFFANTPDILHEYLQTGGRPAFEARLLLAATLAASYGNYSGFELCENVPVRTGSEEYLDSEKYEIRPRDWDQPHTLVPLITRVNAARRAHPALRQNTTLAFHGCDNPQILWYGKTAPGDAVLVAVNTDPHHEQHGWVQVPLDALGLPHDAPYEVEDALDGSRYTWQGEWNYIRLDPAARAGHVLTLA
jgi:starch synthase (maltosyl-transferring)